MLVDELVKSTRVVKLRRKHVVLVEVERHTPMADVKCLSGLLKRNGVEVIFHLFPIKDIVVVNR